MSVLGCEQETTMATATLQIEGTESRSAVPKVEDGATQHGEEVTAATAAHRSEQEAAAPCFARLDLLDFGLDFIEFLMLAICCVKNVSNLCHFIFLFLSKSFLFFCQNVSKFLQNYVKF